MQQVKPSHVDIVIKKRQVLVAYDKHGVKLSQGRDIYEQIKSLPSRHDL